MFRKIYYVRPRSVLRNVRSVLAPFLAVKGCSGVFDDVCRGLDFGVFGERSPFCGILRVKIYESVNVDQAVLFSIVVDGGFFLD
ncbi:hypothetical protein MUO79_06945 [Candidatus Bathyarchaeota archaeon]|nr:hypothetical protein [Candidatus Bathyarchaeota archaeon]